MKKNKKNAKNKSYGRGRKNIDRFTARSAVKRGSKARMAQARRHMSDESVVDGVFSSARSGYGFVRPTVDGWNGDDIFIPARFSSGALNGDRVRVRYRKYRDRDGTERTEGRITEVLEAVNKTAIGTLIEGGSLRRFRGGHHFGRGKLFLVPDDTKLNITAEECREIRSRLSCMGAKAIPEFSERSCVCSARRTLAERTMRRYLRSAASQLILPRRNFARRLYPHHVQ